MSTDAASSLAISPAQLVIGALERGSFDPRPVGHDEWESKCPCHKGTRRNLSVKAATDGTVLIRCHHIDDAGQSCPVKAIVAELGLDLKDLFAGSPRKPKSEGRTNRSTAKFETPLAAGEWLARKSDGTITGRWLYRDSNDVAVLAVYRIESPKGKTYRPVGLDLESRFWKIGDPKGPLPLYRLKSVVASDRVFFFEGELCADLGRKLGLVSTTTAHGAQSPHLSDLGPLAGKEVVIVPDRDAPGEAYAAKLLALLAKLDPKTSVRILRLDVPNEGDDLAEWVAARPGVDLADLRAELETLADACPLENLDVVPPREVLPQVANEQPQRFRATDLGNAERLTARHGQDLRFCHPWQKWLVYDGTRWLIDQTGEARRRARETSLSIYKEAVDEADPDRRKHLSRHAVASEQRDRIAAMLHLAQAESGIPILPEEMDSDPWLFNCLNGTIDLRTGSLRPHRREDLITKICRVHYDPNAAAPLWGETIYRFLVKNEIVDYFQKICGYAMAGVIRDHILPVCHGSGSNGKSTILGALLDAFGPDYGMRCGPDLLMSKKHDGHPTDRADLFGKRLVIGIETEEGRRLNEVQIKELTGGDRIRARRMREDFWEFKPTHTLMLATNHEPAVKGTDGGIWRRLKKIPFTVVLNDSQADKAMPEKLQAELPGILAWCVRGCIAWQKEGLVPPEDVVEATAKYRAGQDLLGRFLDENCLVNGSVRVKASDIYARYVEWARFGNEHIVTMKSFGAAIQERGFEPKKSGVMWYIGIALKPNGDNDVVEESGSREECVF